MREQQRDHIEQLIFEAASKHKMYASDKVWRNIMAQTQGTQTWKTLTLSAVGVIVLLIVTTIIFNKPVDYSQIFETPTLSHQVVDKQTQNFENQLSASALTQSTLERLIQPQSKVLAVVTEPQKIKPVIEVVKETPTVLNETIDEINDVNAQIQAGSLQLIPTANIVSAQSNVTSTVQNTTSIDIDEAVSSPSLSLLEKPNAVDLYLQEFGFEAKPKTSNYGRWGYQVFVTPSQGFRKLFDTKNTQLVTAVSNHVPAAVNVLAEVEDVVHHKSAPGTEVGVLITYAFNSKFKIRSGLQFNSRQYEIQAFSAGANVASINLVNDNGVDIVNKIAFFKNTNGDQPTELSNKQYQISLPIGIQYQLVSGKIFGLGIGASLQPTYTFNKEIYMLSSDYRYYVDGSSYIRRWNINSAAELNMTVNFGNYQWILGPQIRYQHLPTYNKNYSIKEYLIDYGFKFAISKPLH